MKPYKFEPLFVEKIWGGDRLAAFKGLKGGLANVGESWELSGISGHESVTAERGLVGDVDVGLTLTELIRRHKEALVGASVYRRFGDSFPLLAKFIDSRQDLSIQVHPNDELAQKRHGCRGKSEMWYVIKTEPSAKMYVGFRERLTPDDYEKALASGAPESLLSAIACHESHDGDVYYLPAGRIHAIGAGNLLAEIQQASDITYRVYDYGRRDADGKCRELHTELAKDAIDFTVQSEYRQSYDSTTPVSKLVACPHFEVSRIVVQNAREVDLGSDSFVIAMCLQGEANLNGVAVRQGETLLVPASENVLHITGDATFLAANLPRT